VFLRQQPDYDPRWYVVQTHWNYEGRVSKLLHDQGYQVFYPETVAEWRKKRNKKASQRTALFPQYIFVNFDVNQTLWRPIYGTTGVLKIFGVNPEAPTPLPRGVVEELQGRPEIPSRYVPPDLTGKVLEINEGPMQHFTGVCTWSTAKRVRVLMQLFERDVTIELFRYQTEEV